MKFYTWTKNWEEVQLEFYKEPFLAVDPGKTGAAICCQPDGTMEKAFSLNGLAHKELAIEMSRLGIKTIIMEDQYVGRNPKTVMLLRLSVGVLLGRLEERLGELDVIFTEPNTWQSTVLPGVKGRKDLKLAAKEWVRAYGSPVPEGWKTVELEGFWDADCIRSWWVDVSEPDTVG